MEHKSWTAPSSFLTHWFLSNPSKVKVRPRGHIDLTGYMVEIMGDTEWEGRLGKEELALFRLSHATKPVFYLCAEGEEDLIEWVQAIIAEMYKQRDDTESNPSSH